jgi:hypothetical protein
MRCIGSVASGVVEVASIFPTRVAIASDFVRQLLGVSAFAAS